MSRKVCTIAHNTLRECVRSRSIYGVFSLAIALVVASTLFGSVSIGDQVSVIKDFGLFAMTFSVVAYTVLSGSALLEKELARRTISTVLSKAVSRSEFIIGKFLGLLGAATLLFVILGLALLGYLGLVTGRVELLLLQAYWGIFLELTIVCALTMLFSAIVTTPILAGCFTLGIIITGRSAEYLLYFARAEGAATVGAPVLEFLYLVIPHLHAFVLSDQVVQGVLVTKEHLIWGAAYALAYSSCLLWIACLTFARRNFSN